MTSVNWELLPGQAVEDLVAALLILTDPRANQITASRGDDGIDILRPHGDGIEVVQVKRYSRALTGRQRSEIESSWKRFRANADPAIRYEAWTLATPWNPSKERLKWLKGLGHGTTLDINWMGLTQLNVLAAKHQDIVEYYVAGGATRIQELMASALAGSKEPPPGAAGDQLLDAVVERQKALTEALKQVDPFYTYEVEVKTGPLPADPGPTLSERDLAAALVTFEAVDHAHYIVTRIMPVSPHSAMFRPIRHTIQFQAQSQEELLALSNFHDYGTPIEKMPAQTIESEGPPGTTRAPGSRGLVSVTPLSPKPAINFEMRVVDASGTIQATLPIVDAEMTTGIGGRGIRLAGKDPSVTISFEALFGTEDRDATLNLQTSDVTGRPVVDVVEALGFMADLESSPNFQLAFKGGVPITPPWPLREPNETKNERWHRLASDLAELQRHTVVPLRMPQSLTRNLADQVRQLANLVRGETVQWTNQTIGITVSDAPYVGLEPRFAVAVSFPMNVMIDGETIELDQVILLHSPEAEFSAGTDVPALRTGDAAQIETRVAPTLRAVPRTPDNAPGGWLGSDSPD